MNGPHGAFGVMDVLPEGYGEHGSYGDYDNYGVAGGAIRRKQRVADPRIAEIDAQIKKLRHMNRFKAPKNPEVKKRKEQIKRLLAKRKALVGQLKANKIKEVADKRRMKKAALKQKRMDRKSMAQAEAAIDAEADDELAMMEEDVAPEAEVAEAAAEEGMSMEGPSEKEAAAYSAGGIDTKWIIAGVAGVLVLGGAAYFLTRRK
jgi:hypothetical protein